MTSQRKIVEVTRLVTDGTKNACSFLYSAAARVAKELGYESIQTFILESESGVSLIASGWELEHTTNGGVWDTPSRRRKTHHSCPKHKYVKRFKAVSQEILDAKEKFRV